MWQIMGIIQDISGKTKKSSTSSCHLERIMEMDTDLENFHVCFDYVMIRKGSEPCDKYFSVNNAVVAIISTTVHRWWIPFEEERACVGT